MSLVRIKSDFRRLADDKQAAALQRFFKTGKGQYGAGDKFLGIKVPLQRQLAKKYGQLPLREVLMLLHSPYHEHRLTALLILVKQFAKGDKKTKAKIYRAYLKNYNYINNWDLVDLSAPNIVGTYLTNKSRDILYRLAKSANLWKKRIAIISTFAFIRAGQLDETYKIAEILLADRHDLIHKAAGWMLREAGKRNEKRLEEFLDKNFKKMPRTTLRYAIEKFDERQRKYYLTKR